MSVYLVTFPSASASFIANSLNGVATGLGKMRGVNGFCILPNGGILLSDDGSQSANSLKRALGSGMGALVARLEGEWSTSSGTPSDVPAWLHSAAPAF